MRRSHARGAHLLTLLLLLSLLGCGPAPEAPADDDRALTAEEANTLALTRYRLQQRGTVTVRVAVPVESQTVVVEAALDVRRRRAYGTFSATGAGSSAGLIWWNERRVAILPSGTSVPVTPLPEDGWTRRLIDHRASQLDAGLLLAVSLGSDRPENPLLLRQGDARRLGSTTLRGNPIDTFRGPSPSGGSSTSSRSRLTWFVDAGGALHRVTAAGAAGDGPTVIDLLEDTDTDVPLLRRAGA